MLFGVCFGGGSLLSRSSFAFAVPRKVTFGSFKCYLLLVFIHLFFTCARSPICGCSKYFDASLTAIVMIGSVFAALICSDCFEEIITPI